MFGRDLSSGGSGGGWVIAARRVPGSTYMQHHLTPGVTYTFIVRAENSHGLSPPSALSDPITVEESINMWGEDDQQLLGRAKATLLADNVVQLTDAQPVASTSVKLVWEVIKQKQN